MSGAITGGLLGILLGVGITALMLLGPGMKRPPLSTAAPQDAMRFLVYVCVRLAANCAIIGAVASLVSWWQGATESNRTAINTGAMIGAIMGFAYGLSIAPRGLGSGQFLAECLFWGIANAVVGAVVGATIPVRQAD